MQAKDFNHFSVRPLTQDDLPAVLQIEKVSYLEPQQTPWSRESFEAEMAKPYARAYVLTDDETDSTVAGYIVFWLQAEACSLLNVAVNLSFRGLGFGEQLIRAMIKDVVREEYPRIVLEVRASNEGAIRLYQKIGFKETHRRLGFYKDGEAALVMELKTSEITGLQ